MLILGTLLLFSDAVIAGGVVLIFYGPLDFYRSPFFEFLRGWRTKGTHG